VSTDAIRTAEHGPPTTELVTGVVGDGCPSCHSPMAPDQSYCLNCGERRGRARFSPDTVTTQTTAMAAAASPLPPPHPHSRFSPGTTIVAGVATLLIAMAVGVLIGVNTNNSGGRVPAAQVVTVNGGGAGANTTAATPRSPSTAGGSHKAAKPTVVHVTAKAAKAATAAASKVLGSSKNLSNNVTQQVGGSCSGGSGCQNGKFTGNFFPTG